MTSAALRLEPYRAETHYPIISAWWRAHGSRCLPVEALPPTGVIVTRDKIPVAASFCFLSNARVAYVDFTVTEPGLNPLVSLKAAKMAVEGAIEIARAARCLIVWTLTANRAIQRIYSRCGFVPTSPQQHYYLLLDASVFPDMLSD